MIEGSERSTTKCCGVCGLRTDPGSSEVYSCSCFIRNVDRDLHGARNYYIKGKSRIQDDCVDKEVYKFVNAEVLSVVVGAALNSICSGTAITVRG